MKTRHETNLDVCKSSFVATKLLKRKPSERAWTWMLSAVLHMLSKLLDGPYGKLKLEHPNTYSIDLRQMEANLLQILLKIITNHKMHIQHQGRHFLEKKKPCGTLHNIAKGLVPLLSAAICRSRFRYLPLFAANPSAIGRYWPLTIPLFVVICFFFFNCYHFGLMMSTGSSP